MSIAEGKQKAEDREALLAQTRAEIARLRAQQTLIAIQLKGLEEFAASSQDQEDE